MAEPFQVQRAPRTPVSSAQGSGDAAPRKGCVEAGGPPAARNEWTVGESNTWEIARSAEVWELKNRRKGKRGRRKTCT